MSPPSIATLRAVREMLEATHLVLFAIDSEGEQYVGTHGASEADAKVAAEMGNCLKGTLGWPEHLCNASPLPRICKNCSYWKVDYGTWCFNGWTGDGTEGWCRFEPEHVKTTSRNTCGFFSPSS